MQKRKNGLQEFARKIRRDIIENSYKANACHIGSSLSCVEIIISLYCRILKKGDIFIFSKASGACALYSVLAEKGNFAKNKIAYYLKKYPLAGKEVPGVIWSAGSLGHGLPVALGMALADRKRRVYCLISDGEMQEGTTWESALFANHHNLNNLIVIVDRNYFQACGNTEKIAKLEPLEEKWKAFGWQTRKINGHDFSEIENSLNIKHSKPLIIIADTIKGKGISFCENNYTWQYRNLNEELFKIALKELE